MQPDSASATVRALSSQLKELKQRYAHEVGELRAALEVAQGENLTLRRRLRRSTDNVGTPNRVLDA